MTEGEYDIYDSSAN